MTLRPSSPRARQRWVALAGALTLIALLFSGAVFAVHDDGQFELDKNASNDVNATPVGYLNSNINNSATSINVCRTSDGTNNPHPEVGDTIVIRAERMEITAIPNGTFGGNCPGTKVTYTVVRGVQETTARAQSGGGNNVGAAVTLVRTATKAGPDWNQVYALWKADPTTKCLELGLVECTFIEDGIGPTTFIGGSTKDHLPVSGWKHTSGASPDKGEILNAYAAKAIAADGDQLIYFGMDRYAVDGSTDIGFWFFKESVTLNEDGTFSGTQTAGDILLLGTFTQGGATSSVRVFTWVGTGGNQSGTIQGPIDTFSDCVPGNAGDAGCATVNNTTIEVPWDYTFKGESFGGWIPLGGFFEGGINLTANNLEGCFSSFLAETRSSPEITAVLKDFALGDFEACDSGLTTAPGNGTEGPENVALTDTNANGIVDISIGTGSVTVRDRASLTVTGVTQWSGALDFYLCKVDAPGLCETGGTKIGGSIPVTQATPQPVLSDAATITSTGRYCWRGVFTSATTGVPNRTDARINECFEVLPVTPDLSTSVVTAAVALGSPVQDNASLTVTATQPGTPIGGPAGAAAGGVIRFTLVKDNCSTLATGTGTNPQDVNVTGDGSYGPVSFTPDSVGRYHWKAQYIPAAGDVNNNGTTHNALCNDPLETVTVIDARITVSPLTATNEVNDPHVITATVESNSGSGWTAAQSAGVTFSLLNNSANAAFVGGVNTCDTNASGQCSVTINTSTAGSVDIRATSTFTVSGVTFTRTTGSGGNNSADANKVYVDASIAISPQTATNNIDEEHVFTITVTSLPASAAVTFTSITPSISPAPGSYATTCATPTVVDNVATCTVTINHGSAATFTLNAAAVLTIAGEQITRDTDPDTLEVSSGPSGSGPATKTYVSGSLTWLKHDQDGVLLGGATFEVCQTHVLVTTGLAPELVQIVDAENEPDPDCVSVTDNVAPDTDTDDGEFKLEGLSLGTWTIRETAAPSGYSFDSTLVQTVQLTFAVPNGSAANPFVNYRLYKIIIFVCNESLGTLEPSDVTLAGKPATVTLGSVPASLAAKGVTEADICGINTGAVYGGLNQGTYAPSIVIPRVSIPL